MRLYTLKSHDGYGFWTGRTSTGKQVLMGVDWNALVCLRFSNGGDFLMCIERPFDVDGQPINTPVTQIPHHVSEQGQRLIDERFEKWRDEVIVEQSPIRFKEFFHPERFIGVEEIPSFYQDFLNDPSEFSDEDRDAIPAEIQNWKDREDFVFWFNENYDCNKDGEVVSS